MGHGSLVVGHGSRLRWVSGSWVTPLDPLPALTTVNRCLIYLKKCSHCPSWPQNTPFQSQQFFNLCLFFPTFQRKTTYHLSMLISVLTLSFSHHVHNIWSAIEYMCVNSGFKLTTTKITEITEKALKQWWLASSRFTNNTANVTNCEEINCGYSVNLLTVCQQWWIYNRTVVF